MKDQDLIKRAMELLVCASLCEIAIRSLKGKNTEEEINNRFAWYIKKIDSMCGLLTLINQNKDSLSIYNLKPETTQATITAIIFQAKKKTHSTLNEEKTKQIKIHCKQLLSAENLINEVDLLIQQMRMRVTTIDPAWRLRIIKSLHSASTYMMNIPSHTDASSNIECRLTQKMGLGIFARKNITVRSWLSFYAGTPYRLGKTMEWTYGFESRLVEGTPVPTRPCYLGSLINDAIMCSQEIRESYNNITKTDNQHTPEFKVVLFVFLYCQEYTKSNNVNVTIKEGVTNNKYHYSCLADRNIPKDQQLFIYYGPCYWLEKLSPPQGSVLTEDQLAIGKHAFGFLLQSDPKIFTESAKPRLINFLLEHAPSKFQHPNEPAQNKQPSQLKPTTHAF